MFDTAKTTRPPVRGCAAIGLLLLAGFFLTACEEAHSTKGAVMGEATVIDGQTLEIEGQRMRLSGVEAFQLRQTCGTQPMISNCGVAAKAELERLVTSNRAVCWPLPEANSATEVAECRIGERDLGAAMIASGWAIADRSRPLSYAELENEARGAKRGAWSGWFVAPRYWKPS